MADIKSTIDIIMERTKNLTMTEEEKEAFHRKDWADKAVGWVQRFLGGKMGVAELKTELVAGEQKFAALRDILKAELITHIQLGGDNKRMFYALEEVLGISTDPLFEMIQMYQDDMDAKKARYVEHLREVLEKRGIRGSSVIPNMACDEGWMAFEQQLNTDFLRQLKSLTDN